MMIQNFYAGIGSRATPIKVLQHMTALAETLSSNGYTLRSGGAKGADSAFEQGSTHSHIYRAKDATAAAMAIAEKHHPNWKACNEYVRRLHGRNALIILGMKLKTPSDFCICWTPNGKVTGGTGLGLRICETYNIPIINLGK